MLVQQIAITAIAAAAIIGTRPRHPGPLAPDVAPAGRAGGYTVDEADTDAWLARVAEVREEDPFAHLMRPGPARPPGRHRGEESPAEAGFDSTAAIRVREALAGDLGPYLESLPGYEPRHG